jgi:hypothetical protein
MFRFLMNHLQAITNYVTIVHQVLTYIMGLITVVNRMGSHKVLKHLMHYVYIICDDLKMVH